MGKVFLEKHKEIIELNEVGIDRISELVTDSLTKLQVERKDIIRLRLAFEDILIVWKTRLGDNISKCTFSRGERFGRVYITVGVPGNKMDPGETDCDDSDEILYSSLLAQAGIAPAYSYTNGENRLVLNPKKPERISTTKQQLIAVASALLLGVLCNLLPPEVVAVISGIISPIFSTFLGVLTALAGPLIFLSVCVGIINIGDISAVERIGKVVVPHYIIGSSIAVICTALCAVCFFNGGEMSAGGSGDVAMKIYTMILDIIPDNIINTFAEGNTLQIIFMAICAGIVLVLLGDKASKVQNITIQLNTMVKTMMEILGKYISILIFVSIISFAISDEMREITKVLKGFLVFLAIVLIINITYTVILSIKLKVPCSLILKKFMPAFLIALSTASSTASLPTMMESCEKRMGISERVVKFAVPIGQVVFKNGDGVRYIISVFFFAEIYGIEITPSWVVAMIIGCILLSIATPPVAGGGLVVYAVLFALAGIPEAAMSIAIVWALITDFFGTACSIFGIQSEVLLSANRLGELDRDVLTRQDNGVKAPNV